MEKLDIKIAKPFGPTIAKVVIPDEMISKLNNYIDETIKDKEKSKAQDHGKTLAGQVTQELVLDDKFCETSGWLKFLGLSVGSWIKLAGLKDITKFKLINSWAVRQFKGDYNPTHWHNGHVSGVGYLKVPNELGGKSQGGKITNPNGKLELIHGTKQFLSQSTFIIKPKVGEFYLFPNYMMHTVYPFKDTDDERRSISFNAYVDDEVYNVYADRI
tara:strand:+ start:126 stop:770 length:645 start_codon:yes stop_codon:yes gene_type:complete